MISSQEQMSRAIAAYDGLLVRMSETTDLLLSAANASDGADMNRLLEVRSGMCSEIAECTAALNSLAQGSDGTHPANLDQVRAHLASLAEKQEACEAALSERLSECRKDLLTLRQGHRLHEAYSVPAKRQDARFLDSKR